MIDLYASQVGLVFKQHFWLGDDSGGGDTGSSGGSSGGGGGSSGGSSGGSYGGGGGYTPPPPPPEGGNVQVQSVEPNTIGADQPVTGYTFTEDNTPQDVLPPDTNRPESYATFGQIANVALNATARVLEAYIDASSLGTTTAARSFIRQLITSEAGWIRFGREAGKAADEVIHAAEGAGKAVEKPLYRYMSEGELEAVKETGYLRGGNSGPTFWTDSSYKSAENAAERLSLPNTPQYRVEFEITNSPTIEGGTRVQPNFNRLGGGREYWSNDPVQVEIINAQPIGLR